MKQPTFETICDVCGGKGYGTIECLRWDGILKSHTDPRICAENIKQKSKQEQL